MEHKTSYKFIIGLCLSFSLVTAHSIVATSQRIPYNLNITTQLPTNHIYTSVVDHLGYLWLATPKGVVRYNGYEPRIFNINNGLPTDDVWYLIEDHTGRMWLSNISNEIGYIKDNQYIAAVKNAKGLYNPKSIVRYKKGVAILNQTYNLGKKNDDMQLIIHTDSGSRFFNIFSSTSDVLINEESDIIKLSSFARGCFVGKITDTGADFKPLKYVKLFKKINSALSHQTFFRKYWCSSISNSKQLLVWNIDADKIYYITYPFANNKEKIVYNYARNSRYIAISTENVYVYDTVMNLAATYSLSSLTGGAKSYDNNPYIFYEFPFWGLTLATKDNGIYITSQDTASILLPAKDINLDGYNFIGSFNTNMGVWWHPGKHLIKYVSANATEQVYVPYFTRIKEIALAKNNDSLLLASDKGIFWLPGNKSGYHSYFNDTRILPPSLSQGFSKAIAIGNDTSFTIGVGRFREFYRSTKNGHRILLSTYCDKMAFDACRYGIWLYRNQMIIFYDIRKDTFRYMYPSAIKELGLRKIETIVIDEKYGNVFIKDYDQIYLLNDSFTQALHLYPHHRFDNAQIQVQNGKLIVAGRFGLLCSDITGKSRLENTKFYENFKDIYYKSVYDMQPLAEMVILNTDKGVYKIPLSAGQLIDKKRDDSFYRFIAYTNDTIVQVNDADTLILNPGTLSIHWDVINPKGTGKLELAYWGKREKKTWNIISGPEMNLTGLSPGKFHLLYLQAKDEIWQSRELPVYIFIEPYWWQKAFFIGLFEFSLLLLVATVAWFTRKMVVYKQLQKRMMVEMGLAGIHSQINPHFVFNSLTTAQFFIRTNDVKKAYEHINRFSKLLRSFLFASKHKYITIEEEITHLTNYIELQLSRFSEPFDYTVFLSPQVDPHLKIPSLLLQPLIENAIQHGFFNKTGKGLLSLSFTMENKKLIITVEDNGIGREQAKLIQMQSGKKESYGNELIEKLIFVFNKYEKVNINLSYIDKAIPESGTIVKIIISNTFV